MLNSFKWEALLILLEQIAFLSLNKAMLLRGFWNSNWCSNSFFLCSGGNKQHPLGFWKKYADPNPTEGFESAVAVAIAYAGA